MGRSARRSRAPSAWTAPSAGDDALRAIRVELAAIRAEVEQLRREQQAHAAPCSTIPRVRWADLTVDDENEDDLALLGAEQSGRGISTERITAEDTTQLYEDDVGVLLTTGYVYQENTKDKIEDGDEVPATKGEHTGTLPCATTVDESVGDPTHEYEHGSTLLRQERTQKQILEQFVDVPVPIPLEPMQQRTVEIIADVPVPVTQQKGD